ncbi:M3 family metallopeptidase [Halodesulfovibrio sp.]|jgi:M3 family oligoendopeptidase|uniref:M3 family metallopeptidase n=1 Tax=Halodesulfovibrio sp. TaxID=1912772 RepID=UPI0025CEEBF8|nr:M3 family metallopeptidase [Halodesulfovibrio sp.]MCT4626407.1 M3 family metallopeptidase [Halodesulfovibrio sp.]
MAPSSIGWTISNCEQHSVLVETIIAMQKIEPQFRDQQTSAYPSSPEGQAEIFLQKAKAIAFYKELLSLFTIYWKQNMVSTSRRVDFAKAQKEYGTVLRTLSRQLATLSQQSPVPTSFLQPMENKRDTLPQKNDPEKANNSALAQQKQQEQHYQHEYFKLVASIDDQSHPALTDTLTCLPRSIRKKQWIATSQNWEHQADQLDNIFDKITAVRHQIALCYGKQQYSEVLRQKQNASGCTSAFTEAVAMPCRSILSKLQREKKRTLHLTRLRPFDAATRNARGFDGHKDWCTKTSTVLATMHPSLSALFQDIINEGLYDLTPRTGKAPESFCLPLPYSKKAFLFLQLRGGRKDIMTGFHELGHAFHSILSASNDSASVTTKIVPETSEFFALTLELLAAEHLAVYYTDPDAAKWAKRKFIESILQVFLTHHTLYHFEHAIYSAKHTSLQRRQLFAALISKNLGQIDYAGYETALELWMYRIPLLISSPGYFSNYAMTQLGALFFFDQIQKGVATIEDVLSLVKYKGHFKLDAIFNEIGFSITPETIQKTIQSISTLLEKK